MVYRKKNGYKKGYRKRYRKNVPFYEKKYSALDIAKKAFAGVNYLKGLVNSELHKHDQGTSINPVNTGTVVHLTNIPVGDSEITRTGNSIYVRSVAINFELKYNTSSASQAVVIWLVCDEQQVADTVPTFADIFTSTDVNALLNISTVGRYSILKKIKLIVNVDEPIVLSKMFLRMRKHVRYNGGNAGDIQKCGLYLVVTSDATAVLPTLRYYSRVSFHDN